MPNPEHPWLPAKREPKGDPEDSTVYLAVGRALSRWEWLEATLAEIFKLLCNAEFDGAERAYGSVVAFSGRRNMLDAAFEVFPWRRKDDVKRFPKLVEQIQRFSARRNEIAHGNVMGIGIQGENLGFYLVPASYNSNKQYTVWDLMDASSAQRHMEMTAGKYAYTSAQINAYESHFLRLREEVIDYMIPIRKYVREGR